MVSEKQRIERWIFDRVFDAAHYSEVVSHDSPDFIVRQGQESFGVEVTQLFEDEGDARAKSIPDYVDRILKGQGYLHKDDAKLLPVERIQIHDKDGNLKYSDYPVVLRNVATPKAHYDSLADLIVRKSAAFQNYDPSLNHVNLVIYDWFSATSSVPDDYSTGQLFMPKMREAMANNPFQSTYLISRSHSGRTVFRRLEQLLLLEAWMIFMEALQREPEVMELLDEADAAVLFALALRRSGEPVQIVTDADRPFAYYKGAGLAHYQDRGTVIHDYSDWEVPVVDEIPTVGSLPRWVARAITEMFVALRPLNGMHTSYAEDIRPVPDEAV